MGATVGIRAPHTPRPLAASARDISTGLAVGTLALKSAVPNPFRGLTTIEYQLPADRRVDVGIYDVTGRLVRSLVNGPRPAGPGSVVWDGRDTAGRPTASGVYYVRLRTEGRELSRPLVRLR